jgi:hypothetical protein
MFLQSVDGGSESSNCDASDDLRTSSSILRRESLPASGLCSEPFMHSSQPPCTCNLSDVQVDCMLKAIPDIGPVERRDSVRKLMRSSAAGIELQAALKTISHM